MVVLAIDPFNVLYLLVFTWLLYASGYGKMMVAACRANHWGFVRPSKVKPLGFVGPGDELQ